MSLDQWGAKSWASLRGLERDEHGDVCCPVSGQPITHSRGELEIPVARLADEELREALRDAGVEYVRSRGYESHAHEVLVPETVDGPRASGYSTRMVGVRAELSDDGDAWIPVHTDDLEAADRALELAREASAAADGAGSTEPAQATGATGEAGSAAPGRSNADRPAVVEDLDLPTEYDDGHPRWTYVGHTRHDDVDVYAGRGGDDGETDLLTAEIGEPGWLGNPYPVGDMGDREEVVGMYTDALLTLLDERPDYRRELVDRIRGTVLGCWCHRLEETGDADAPLCHADVLARVVDRVIQRRGDGSGRGGERDV